MHDTSQLGTRDFFLTTLLRGEKLIQDGGQFVDLGENISRSKTNKKICNRLLFIVLESLSNETIKFFVAISL